MNRRGHNHEAAVLAVPGATDSSIVDRKASNERQEKELLRCITERSYSRVVQGDKATC